MRITSTRLARNLSAAVVAGIAAWSSYHHMVSVALNVGERPDVAYLVPLSVDGMLVVASITLADDKAAGRKPRMSARIAFWVGVIASLAANIGHAQPTTAARIVSAWPALALLLVVELLTRSGKLAKGGAVNGPSPEASQVETPGSPAEVPPPPKARRARATAKATRRPAAKTRAMAADLMDAEPGISRAEVARRLRVTPRRLREVLNETESPTHNGVHPVLIGAEAER